MKIIERNIFPEVARHLDEREITVITGGRQTGKTTLLHQLRDYLISKKGVSPSQIKFFNLDLITDLKVLETQEEFRKYINEELQREEFLYIFVDEIQRLEDPGRFLKGIYDIGLPLKFIVSGSSSLEVRSKVFESLVGRKRVFYLWPFSFKEYLSSQSPPLELPAMDASETTKRAVLDKLYEFLVFGGYPRVVLAKVADEKIQLLNEIYSSYVEKDIVGLLRISDPLLFTRLVTLLASQVGGLVNLSEIGNTLRIDQRKIEAYIAALENTFIVRLVRPYSTNIRKELAKMPKVYFVDAGLRNFSLRDFRRFLEGPDKGKLLENFVFTVLVRRSEGGVNFWRTKDKAEVNFVVRDYLGNVIPIEVKALSLGDFRIPNGLRSFIKRYRPKRAFVVNLSMGGSVVYGDTEVSFILPYELESIDITSGTTY